MYDCVALTHVIDFYSVSQCANSILQLWPGSVGELYQIAVGVQQCVDRDTARKDFNVLALVCVCMHFLAGRVQHLHSVAKLLAGLVSYSLSSCSSWTCFSP